MAAAVMYAGNGQRVVALDALRGVAILMVIIHHVGLKFGVGESKVAGLLVGIGWAGVDLFFAISGFLITSILVRDAAEGELKGFFIRRFFRIVPLYFAALALFALASVVTGIDLDVLRRIWINALFLTAWVIPFLGENGIPYTITWSVSVEEFAYLLLGWLALQGLAGFRRALLLVVASALILRVIGVFLIGLKPVTMYYFAPGRIDAIAFGGMAAFLSSRIAGNQLARPWLPWVTFAATLGLLAMFGRDSIFVATIGYSVLAMVAAWLVVTIASRSSEDSHVATRVLAKLGLVSYFVYLFHQFVIAAVQMLIPETVYQYWNLWAMSALVTLASYALAVVSWKWFELPLISLGRRIASCREANPCA